MAEKDRTMKEAANTVYLLTQSELIREQCWAREDYYRTMKGFTDDIAALRDENGTLRDENGTLKDENAALKEQLRLMRERLSSLT